LETFHLRLSQRGIEILPKDIQFNYSLSEVSNFEAYDSVVWTKEFVAFSVDWLNQTNMKVRF
jgi:hypothetical protein